MSNPAPIPSGAVDAARFNVGPGKPASQPASKPTELTPERAELREAARAFEAIFVRRLLASARASSIADQTPFTGPGLEQFETMRDEQVAKSAAETGAFGLADQIEKQLASFITQRDT